MNIRVASDLDYPDLRLIYLESRRKSFHWADIEEMTLEDFDKHIRRIYNFSRRRKSYPWIYFFVLAR